MATKKIPEKIKPFIKEYIECLKADKLPIQQVFLFGSYAKGRQRKWSDIDLCVISPRFKNPWQALQYLWSKRKISDANCTIEPMGFCPKDFNEKYDSLIQEIKQTGIEIEL